MYYLYIVIWGSFWLILFSEWYCCRETELFVAVTVRLMDWTLVNNSLYLRWLLYLLCSLYSLIIFSIYVCIHIHYNSVENLRWQKLAETCFCRTGLNRGLNHLRQKPANPESYALLNRKPVIQLLLADSVNVSRSCAECLGCIHLWVVFCKHDIARLS